LRELVALVLEDAPLQLAGLASAFDRDDGAEIRRLAHSLRGAVSNISARPIVVALQDLEAVARGGTAGDCGGPLALAQAAWRDLERDLRAWMVTP
jgi:HPt (histidine-containing phosphotransfer) domain-containing protein